MTDSRDVLKEAPFSYKVAKDKVFINYLGREIMVLKNRDAVKLLNKIEPMDMFNEQLTLAKITGYFKH